MRKALALVALCIFALCATAFGSPPTHAGEKAFSKTKIVKTNTIHTADTSAVATRDAEARTVETVAAVNSLNESNVVSAAPQIGRVHVLAVNRYAADPPERLQGIGARRDVSLTVYRYNPETAAARGYPRKV